MTPCWWRDDEQSARQLLAVFAGGVKICKACLQAGPQRAMEWRACNAHFAQVH
jgi:hypothetical protein